MTRNEADKKMKDRANRELWIMEVIGDCEEPKSTKYNNGFLYVVWDGYQEAEFYDTSNIYGECEDIINLKEYEEMSEYTPSFYSMNRRKHDL
jgi:hypothetical protein